MVAFPPCKINLGLRIISKRPDGYHNLETCFYPVPWTDVLEIIRSDSFSFTQSGLPIPGQEEDNLCIRAYRMFQREFQLAPVKIHLHKVLPTGAGLGGGSSDAAYALRLLNQLFELGLATEQLNDYAAQLGSDCSFFIQDNPMLGSGRGEILSPCAVALTGLFVVLVKPEIHVSTADAYANVTPVKPDQSLTKVLESPISSWKNILVNDFEKSVFEKYPIIRKIKNDLYEAGALYASMSGSGASVYGIFSTPVNLKGTFAGMTYWAGTVS